jgi:hypothetical protein
MLTIISLMNYRTCVFNDIRMITTIMYSVKNKPYSTVADLREHGAGTATLLSEQYNYRMPRRIHSHANERY